MDSSNPVINAAGDNKEIGLRPPERFKDMHDFIDTKRYGWLVSKTVSCYESVGVIMRVSLLVDMRFDWVFSMFWRTF